MAKVYHFGIHLSSGNFGAFFVRICAGKREILPEKPTASAQNLVAEWIKTTKELSKRKRDGE